MYAALVRVSIPGGITDERMANLESTVVPLISGSPGFVAGYWGELVDGDEGLGYILFEDEASAKAASPPVGADMGVGVTVKSVEHHKVAATA